MVKQFQKPKGNGGRQRKFVFCGKNYCFVSWFRENKPFRARIHFGSTYSIGTYSDLEKCLHAIAEFTRDKVMETSGLEQRGWRQRDEKALAQLQAFVKNEELEAAEIERHFAEKKGYKKKKLKLSVPLRKKLMKKTSPSIPPISMKLENEVEPISLGEPLTNFSFLFDADTIKSCETYFNPHGSIVTSPILSPDLSMDVLEPPRVYSPLMQIQDNFQFLDKSNLAYKSHRGPNKMKKKFKLKLRFSDFIDDTHRSLEEPSWWQL